MPLVVTAAPVRSVISCWKPCKQEKRSSQIGTALPAGWAPLVWEKTAGDITAGFGSAYLVGDLPASILRKLVDLDLRLKPSRPRLQHRCRRRCCCRRCATALRVRCCQCCRPHRCRLRCCQGAAGRHWCGAGRRNARDLRCCCCGCSHKGAGCLSDSLPGERLPRLGGQELGRPSCCCCGCRCSCCCRRGRRGPVDGCCHCRCCGGRDDDAWRCGNACLLLLAGGGPDVVVRVRGGFLLLLVDNPKLLRCEKMVVMQQTHKRQRTTIIHSSLQTMSEAVGRVNRCFQ